MPVLQEFQRRPAAGADVAYFVGQAHLLDGGRAVAAADDGDGAVRRHVRHRLRHRARSLGKRLFFEDAHRAVPDHRFGLGDLFLVKLAGLGADVEPFLVGGNVAFDDAGDGIIGHLVGNDVIDRQHDFAAGLGEQALGQFNLIALDKALADLFALGEEEGVRHRPADEQDIGLAEAAAR